MDAVKASQQVNHEQSAVYDEQLQIDHGAGDVVLANTVVHMDGVLTPDLIDRTDLSHVPQEQVEQLKEEVEGGLLTAENLPFLDEEELKQLQRASPYHSLTEEQMKALLYVNSRIRQAQEDAEGSLVDAADDDYPGPAACTVAAACIAVVAVAVYNTAGAVHTAAAAVAVETYVGVT